MTSLVSASKLALAEPRQQARKDGSKGGHPGFQDAVRASGAERHGSPAVRAPATPSSPSPMQGLAQRLDAFEKIASLAADKPAEGVGEVPQPVAERAKPETAQAAVKPSPAPTQGLTHHPETFEKIASSTADKPAGDANVPQRTVERAKSESVEAAAKPSAAPTQGLSQHPETFEKIANLTGDEPAAGDAEVPQRTVERAKAPIAQVTGTRSSSDEMVTVTNAKAGDGSAIAGGAVPELPQSIDEDTGAQANRVADLDVAFDADAPRANGRIKPDGDVHAAKADARLVIRSVGHTDERGRPASLGDKRTVPDEVETDTAESSGTTNSLEPATEPESHDTTAVTTDALSKQPDGATWLPLHDARPAAPVRTPKGEEAAEPFAAAGADAKAIPASTAPREPATSRTTDAAASTITEPDDAAVSHAPRSAPAGTGPVSVKTTAHATATNAQVRTASDVAARPATGGTAQAVTSNGDDVGRRDVSRPVPANAADQAKLAVNVAAQAQSAPRDAGSDAGDRKVSERATSGRGVSTATPAATATTSVPASRATQAADTASVHRGSPSAPASERPQSGKELAGKELAEREPIRADSGDDAKPAVSGDARQADAVRPAPATVTAVSVQAQPTTPAAPAAAVIATVRADASWAAYFRDIQPGASAQVNSLKIQLNPLELGNVTAHLQIKDDAVSVELTAETADAQRQLASDADTIAKSLRALGIDVDRVTVQITARADVQPQTDASGQPRQQGFAADGGASNAREQDGGSRREQQRQSGDPAASASGPSAASSNRSSSARYI